MRILTIVMGLLLTVGGVYSVLTPVSTFASIGWVIGVLLLIAGINIIIDFFTLRKTGMIGIWDLLGGILTIGLSFLILYGQFARIALDAFIIIAFGVWVLVSGILRIVAGLNHRKYGDGIWIWAVLMGILSVLLGIYGFFNPIVFAFAIGWMVGFFIIMQGVNLITLGVALGHDHSADNASKKVEP